MRAWGSRHEALITICAVPTAAAVIIAASIALSAFFVNSQPKAKSAQELTARQATSIPSRWIDKEYGVACYAWSIQGVSCVKVDDIKGR